jgi:tripartite-type tricarboxylate transporter receptor subunit TctC
MRMPIRTLALTSALAALAAFGAPAALAQDAAANYPNRPIRLVVPFPAGGPTDILSRAIAERLSQKWGQGVVVENRPGGNTTIGTMQVVKAEPDGYTLLAAMDSTLVMNPVTLGNLPYDPMKDFTYISMAANNTSLVTVRADDGPKSIAELIERAKAAPKKLSFGAGIVTTRLGGILFAKTAGFEAVLVPYKGSAEVVQALLTKSVDFIVDGAAPSVPLVRGGQFRALAKLNTPPLSALPDVKPLSSFPGLEGLEDIATWVGIVAPAGTPRAIVDKIQREMVEMAGDKALAERLERTGIGIASSTPEAFRAHVQKETVRWARVYKDSGIKID